MSGKLLKRSLFALVLLASPTAAETGRWLNAADITYMLVGRDVVGQYRNGATFTETYRGVGTIEYRDETSSLRGTWTLKGNQFCTHYEGSPGGCYKMRLTSSNCFEYWLVDAAGTPADAWIAVASQAKYDSTCREKTP